MVKKCWRGGWGGLALVVAMSAQVLSAQEAPPLGATPLRLSYVEGNVSFQRPGVADWTPARINAPLAVGDALYVASGANLEIQAGQRAFIRAGGQTYLSLGNQEPDFVQFRVTGGRISADLRSLPPGETLEFDAPNAVFTVNDPGYYRIEVSDGRSQLITRRGGRAVVTLGDGKSADIMPSEEVVVQGADSPTIETYVAPEPDAWDSWNLARTDRQIDSISNRYMPPGVYGGDALDHDGDWRVVPDYGEVWVPDSVPPDWAPYSAGSWLWDPSYHWTWVDDMPWGWAPFHYGRWVFLNGLWAWAPGPVGAYSVYAPALVAFLGGAVAVDSLFWISLSWGEPLVPWWGPAGFVGVPWWGGWRGPRIVNNVVNITNINVFRNARAPHAVIGMPIHRFGHEAVKPATLVHADPARLAPFSGALPMKPERALASPQPGMRGLPPEAMRSRPVIATRALHPLAAETLVGKAQAPQPETGRSAVQRLVSPPRREGAHNLSRPPFGMQQAQERPRPEAPPRFGEAHPVRPSLERGLGRSVPEAPHIRAAPEPRERPVSPPAVRMQMPPPAASRMLPGEPANRLFPERGMNGSHRMEAPAMRPMGVPNAGERGGGGHGSRR